MGAAGFVGLAVAGCQTLFGIERIDFEEPPPPGCVVPDDWESALRLGNLSPRKGAIDLCLAPSDTGEYERHPLIGGLGAGCPSVEYKQLTIPLPVEPGTYDLKAIAGGDDCGDSGLASVNDVTIEDGETHSVLLMGVGEQEEPRLRAFVDDQGNPGNTRLRFIHALVGYGELDAGTIKGDGELGNVLFRDTPFGDQGHEGTELSYAGGYWISPTEADVTYPVGVAEAGTQNPLLVLPSDFEVDEAHSLYAIGRVDSTSFPPELWTCNDTVFEPASQGLFSPCGHPIDLNVDIFNTNLTDLFTPYLEERRGPLVDALRDFDGDLVCLTEIYNPADMQAVLDTVDDMEGVSSAQLVEQGRYDEVLTDQDDNPTDEFYSAPACNAEDAAKLEPLFAYLEDSCVEERDGEHFLSLTGAPAQACLTDYFVEEGDTSLIVTDSWDRKRCWMCTIASLSGFESLEETRRRCTEGDERADRFVFDGSVGLVTLSAYDIEESELHILPASDWGRGIMRSRVALRNGEKVDFYCMSTSVVDDPLTLPYTGPYGAGEYGQTGGHAEQMLEIQRAIDFIEDRSVPGVRSILAATIYSGPEKLNDAGQTLIEAVNPELFDALDDTFLWLVAPDYEFQCNVCPDNPAGGSLSATNEFGWMTSHLFGQGIREHDVIKTSRTFDEPTVETTNGDGETVMIPLSQHYGVRSVVRVAQ